MILSDGLWKRRFAAADDIVGQTILVNGVAREIVGVMPQGFRLPTDYVVDAEEPTALWLPFRLDPTNRGSHGLYAAARLKPGVTVDQANAELNALARTYVQEGKYPEPMQFSPFAITTTDEAVAGVRTALLLVFGAVGFLLLIACANVANLLLVRADGRAREMAVRCALGAKRSRLIRQLLTESAVLAVGAAVLGVALATAAITFVASSAGPHAAARRIASRSMRRSSVSRSRSRSARSCSSASRRRFVPRVSISWTRSRTDRSTRLRAVGAGDCVRDSSSPKPRSRSSCSRAPD